MTMTDISRRRLLKQASGGGALLSVLVSADLIHGQARSISDDSMTRIRESFDFGWKFRRGDVSGAQNRNHPDVEWETVDLPHDWSIKGPFSEKEPSGGPGGYLPTGIGWYRKHFSLPQLYKDGKVIIEFDGVYENSEVWINGRYLGKRPIGYIPFCYDLSPYLGYKDENVIAVKVDNSRQPNCRWYSGSGIYRHTWLLATNKLHVAYWGTSITFPRVSNDASTVQIKTVVQNEEDRFADCVLVSRILDKDGNPVRTSEEAQEINANGKYEFVQQLSVEKPSLWSVEDPYLYTVHSSIRKQGRVVDEYETPFGIREALFDADKGFILNGAQIKLKGVCLHHDAGCLGAAVPERVWERRLEILREMGCNAIRTSHNPYSAEFLDLCDRKGFLVMDEIFDEWKVPKGQIKGNGYSNYFDEWHERDVTSFIHRDRNHPSVVLWSAGNEVGDQSDQKGVETLRKLLELFHREDPTRPVTVGCDRIESEPSSNTARPEFLALLDIVGYNYVDRWRDRIEKYYSIDKQSFPQRRFIGTESGSMSGIRGEYGYLFPGDLPGRFWGYAQNRNIDVEQLWKFVRIHDYVAGDFMWTGIDYLGEAFWPLKSAPAGVIDTCGFKKDGFYFYQSQWTDKPMLHIFPHWNWKGREEQFIPVTCYTNCDTVELFLNGKSVGLKGYAFPRKGMEGKYGNYPARARALRTTADLHLSWDIPYEPGTLMAVGKKDGKVVITTEISTSGEPASIKLLADRNSITADRRDVSHLTVQILDEKGIVVPDADNAVTFDVDGEGILIGVDNGDPRSHENYKSNRRKAFHGMCLAIVQSTRNPGKMHVLASSPPLGSGAVTITTTAPGADSSDEQ